MVQLNLLQLKGSTIYEQLLLEEALLRSDNRNWCIIQEGVLPAIVMGISGKPEQQLNLNLLQQAPVPVIKRFSGGGTVFVDQNTLFITFIFQARDIQIPPCPDKVFHWSEILYRDLFKELPFELKERDYIFSNRKFGGNAQYMRKDRWLHHSTLLWDYNDKNMDYLTLPQRRPLYRADRNHTDFLCRLSQYLPTPNFIWSNLESILSSQFELIHHSHPPQIPAPNRISTQQLF